MAIVALVSVPSGTAQGAPAGDRAPIAVGAFIHKMGSPTERLGVRSG